MALEHNSHVVVKMRPHKKGIIKDSDDNVVGARGIKIVNTKNKAGGRSKTGYKCGYRADFRSRGSKMWEFMSSDEMKKEK